jgi:hypothetical protein
MTLNVPTFSPSASPPIESEVSLARLHVLRAMYLLLVIGGGIVFLPQLIGHEPTARGVIPSMLGALWALACFGLRYPNAGNLNQPTLDVGARTQARRPEWRGLVCLSTCPDQESARSGELPPR